MKYFFVLFSTITLASISQCQIRSYPKKVVPITQQHFRRAFHTLTTTNKPSILRKLLEKIRYPYSIFGAIESNNVEKVLYYIRNNPSVLESRTVNEETPLIIAAKSDNIAMVKILIEAKADLQANDNQGFTALLYAIYNHHTEIVRVLLNNGALPTCSYPLEFDPLHCAVIAGSEEIAQLVLNMILSTQKTKHGTYLHHAISYKKKEIADLLIKERIGINDRDDTGMTPLMHATLEGDFQLVQELLNQGAYLNARDVKDQTARWLAINQCNTAREKSDYFESKKYEKIIALFDNYTIKLRDNQHPQKQEERKDAGSLA